MISKESFLMKLGKRIRDIRKHKGLTQEALAELAGLDRTTISRIESGNQQTELFHVYKIAKALNTKLRDLFDFE